MGGIVAGTAKPSAIDIGQTGKEKRGHCCFGNLGPPAPRRRQVTTRQFQKLRHHLPAAQQPELVAAIAAEFGLLSDGGAAGRAVHLSLPTPPLVRCRNSPGAEDVKLPARRLWPDRN